MARPPYRENLSPVPICRAAGRPSRSFDIRFAPFFSPSLIIFSSPAAVRSPLHLTTLVPAPSYPSSKAIPPITACPRSSCPATSVLIGCSPKVFLAVRLTRLRDRWPIAAFRLWLDGSYTLLIGCLRCSLCAEPGCPHRLVTIQKTRRS
jgi:hypothetical protein